ncbi:MAG: DNA adenine methylase [Defluviitaleaceae bacterium]|nr:DNA adenine methylase [Defluviitaleaceae bacterium]
MDSFIAWVGGKKLLRKVICDKFPKSGYDKYVEVFGGAAWVLLHKEKHAKMEIYNDINSELVNLFKCVQHHPNAIKEELELFLNSREMFNDCKALYKNPALTEIQRAARYYYMIKASYCSKVTSFGAKSRDLSEAEYLKKVKERLKVVVIENKEYEALIKQYDKPSTLFYCDPPYYGSEKLYDTGGNIFDDVQHVKLRDILLNIQGRCVISYNNSDFIKELYKDFKICKVERQNNMGGKYGINKSYKELIITNY